MDKARFTFRGKRCDNNKWAHGQLIKIADNYGNLMDAIQVIDGTTLHNHMVLPETIGQSTDAWSDGGYIYEGDLIRVSIYKNGLDEIVSGIVCWGRFHCEGDDKSAWEREGWHIPICRHCVTGIPVTHESTFMWKIIGNKFDGLRKMKDVMCDD